MPERMEFVFFSIFLACYMYVVYSQASIRAWVFLVLGVVCANLALYYKETAFAMLGVFGFVHFVLDYKNSSKITKTFDVALVLSSVVWLVVYALVVLAQKQGSGSYGDTPYNQVIVMIKVVLTTSCKSHFCLWHCLTLCYIESIKYL